MTDIYLALGSNVGNTRRYLEHAIKLLRASVGNLEIAPLYISKAVGYTDQSDFLNAVVYGQTKLSPQELLKFIKDIEKKVGRVARFRWGPREIDIDIIFYGDQVLDSPDLTVPHPLFAERDFVLRPMLDLDPSLVDPRTKLPVFELLNCLPADTLAIQKEAGKAS
jgi:2-amino-4-hydroxy-6-hydroxymethyldihydropteridine diphosphokinase